MNIYQIGLIANLGINILGALSVYIILRSGQISVGNAGFMAVGAYTASVLSANYNFPIMVSVVIGAIFASVVGALIGIPALRLKGTYLVIVTISFTTMIRSLAQILEITGGAAGFRGISRIDVMGIFIFVGAVIVLLYLFEKSRMGLSMRAVSSDVEAAGAVGIDVVKIKILSFGMGAGIAGIAGGCYAHWAQYIEPGDFTTSMSTMMLLPVVLGGRNRIMGAVLGAAVFTLLPEVLRFASSLRMVVYGIIIIAIVTVKPEGLIGRKKPKQIIVDKIS